MHHDITVAITSCGRLDLLFRTLDSFFTYNTYPIKEVIVIEDSGISINSIKIRNKYKDKITVIENETNLGLIKSLDKLYANIKTEYVFHCEDDWEFYRTHFIEDSFKVLKSDPKITYIGLRSIYHDLINNSTGTSLGEERTIENIRYRKLFRNSECVAFSNNPHLLKITQNFKKLLPFSEWTSDEYGIQKKFENNGFYGVTLENDAVAHIGWGTSHFNLNRKKISVKFKNLIKAFLNILGKDLTFEQ